MPERLEYNPSMGSPEAHLELLKTRMNNAQAEYEKSKSKGKDFEAQTEAARQTYEAAKQEYEEFSSDNEQSLAA